MRDLIARLTVVDDDAATALRVISHFDALVERGTTVTAVLRATAALADCPTGFHDASEGTWARVGADGRSLDAEAGGIPAHAVIEELDQLTVWLERAGEPRPLDRLILERCARGLKTMTQMREVRPSVAAVRVACDSQSEPAERQKALRRLGLGNRVTIVATPSRADTPLPPGPVIEGQRINLLRPEQADHLVPHTVPAGIAEAPAEHVYEAWRNAATALRLAIDPTTGEPLHIRYEQLGSIAALAERFDAESAAAVPDVQRFEELRAKRPWAIPIIDAVTSQTSIREIARRQGLHHSTVIERVDWVEQQLGYSLRDASGHSRSSITLILWRITAAGRPLVPSLRMGGN